MSTAVRRAYLGCLLWAIGASGLGGLSAAQLASFRSDRYGYTVDYPSDWFMNSLAPARDLFDIINFPRSKAVHAVFLPPNGAEISVTPIEARQGPTDPRSSARREDPHKLEEWIAIATRGQQVELERDLKVHGLAITEIRMKGADGLEALDWYFSLRGRLFSARLLCWAGNSKFEELRQILEGVVLTLNVGG